MDKQAFLARFEQTYKPEVERAVVVAVSGGADSLGLLHLLLDSGLDLVPVHLDHQLREGSTHQAHQLEKMLQDWGLTLIWKKADVKTYAHEHKLGIEEAARICRYNTLFAVASAVGAQAVLTAHHQDDQVETVLMHFLRGSGVDGLSGMRFCEMLPQFSKSIPLWRPLLDTPKSELMAYCQAHELQIIEDESNQQTNLFRNRLRHEVIPYLASVQEGFPKILARNAKAIELDRQLLNNLSGECYLATVLEEEPGKAIVFDRAKWMALERGGQTRLLIKAARSLASDTRDLGFEAIERVINGIANGLPEQDFRAKLKVLVTETKVILTQEGHLYIDSDFPQLMDKNGENLMPGKSLQLANGWSLRAKLVDRKRYEKIDETIKTDPMHAWLNPSDLELPMLVRGINSGEQWSPLGMVLQRQRMSEFFINQKIPQATRASWPIVTSGGSVMWVAGKRIAQAWRLLGDENSILHLELIPPEERSLNP